MMKQRMDHPAMLLPEAMALLKSLAGIGYRGIVPGPVIHLVNVRVSQMNGCSYCVGGDSAFAKASGETDERLFTVAAWRHAPYFNEAERAALALAEAVTRLGDTGGVVPDGIWNEAAGHFDKDQMAVLLLAITTINTFNRLNAAIGLPAGTPMPWNQ